MMLMFIIYSSTYALASITHMWGLVESVMKKYMMKLISVVEGK